MSVNLHISDVRLQPVSDSVDVELDNGDVVNCIRVATYQINPKTGASTLVKNSIRYENHAGVRITNVVKLITNNPRITVDRRMWFSKINGAPIYLDNGVFYNANGDIYNGDVTGYQANTGDSSTTVNASTIKGSWVWVRFSATRYLPIFRITKYEPKPTGAPTVTNWYFYDNDVYTIPSGKTVVDELPPPVYDSRHQKVTEESPAVSPTDYPISGFAVAWTILFPTEEDDTIGEIIVDDVPYEVSGNSALNSEAPMGVVIPPTVICNSNVLVHMVYRLRVSPIIMTSPMDPVPDVDVAPIVVPTVGSIPRTP